MGKARSSRKGLRHGSYARRLPEKLRAAGYADRAALHEAAYQEICAAFRPSGSEEWGQAVRFANNVAAMAQRAGIFGTKLECPLFSARLGPRFSSLFPIRINDPEAGVGLVFWVQRKGYWTLPKLLRATFAGARDEAEGKEQCPGSGPAETASGSRNPNPEPRNPAQTRDETAETENEPPLRLALENRLRQRVLRMRRLTAFENGL